MDAFPFVFTLIFTLIYAETRAKIKAKTKGRTDSFVTGLHRETVDDLPAVLQRCRRVTA